MNSLFTSPLKFRLFLFTRLPSAWLAGLRMVSCTEQEARVSIRYGWWTKNPFRSLYFACLAMAAEMSTGALAWMYASKHTPMVSMLVVKMEAEFLKKAVGKIIFTCSDGNGFSDIVKKAVETGEGQTFRSTTTGKDEEGNEVAKFYITWSFKKKSK
jgi:hypothetical protein